jgi:hypothetical protein
MLSAVMLIVIILSVVMLVVVASLIESGNKNLPKNYQNKLLQNFYKAVKSA